MERVCMEERQRRGGFGDRGRINIYTNPLNRRAFLLCDKAETRATGRAWGGVRWGGGSSGWRHVQAGDWKESGSVWEGWVCAAETVPKGSNK